MHGCGIKLWRQGAAPAAAAAAAATTTAAAPPPSNVSVRAAEGRFARDMFAGPRLSPCEDPQSALDAAAEADYAAAQARSFCGALTGLARAGAGAGVGSASRSRSEEDAAQAGRRREGGLGGWLGGLFGGKGGGGGGGNRARSAAPPPLPSPSSARSPTATGGGTALASMKPGDRELLSALVDRMMEHELALAMAEKEVEGQQQQQPKQKR